MSNPAKPWALSKKWSDVLMVEFWAQGDREKGLNLPVSMGCDRATASQPKGAVFFGEVLVAPFFRAVAALAPDVQPVVDMLAANCQQWREMG